MKFWDRVGECNHENISETYYDSGSCATPYCEWAEERCNDCKVYIVTCGCHYMTGKCGWSLKRVTWLAKEVMPYTVRI